MQDTDRPDVARARDDDREAFRALVERHSRCIFSLAQRITGSTEDAEDVVQDTWLKAHNQLSRFEARADFRTWLHRICVNCSIDLIRARAVLTQVARGDSNPDVQRKAIQYLGVNGTQENRQVLADIYAASTDVDIKRQILKAFMISGDRARVVSAATTEKAPELRQEAVRQLGVMGAREELWRLYQKESVVEVKKQILQSMFVGGDATHLVEVANSEPNADLRYTAVRQLGTMGRSRTGEALVSLYAREKEPAVKRQVIKS